MINVPEHDISLSIVINIFSSRRIACIISGMCLMKVIGIEQLTKIILRSSLSISDWDDEMMATSAPASLCDR